MERIANGIASTVILLGTPLAARAQDLTEAAVEDPMALIAGPNFWIALVVGVVLATAFQMMLTNLSLAAGITAVGPVDESHPSHREPHESAGHLARRLSTGFGVWTLATASVALFFACWLAVELSRTLSATAGAVLGLTVWGLFYVGMTMFEVSALSSLVGSLLHTARHGLRTMRDATASLVTVTADVLTEEDDAPPEASLHQAEEARKTAATAAWWSFATALVSAAAAVAGGVVAVLA